jgi:hypothetical protein
MGHFVPALNGSCSCPPMGRDLGPNPARYNGSCRHDTKLFWAVPCLGRAFFSVLRAGPSGPAQMYTYSASGATATSHQRSSAEDIKCATVRAEVRARAEGAPDSLQDLSGAPSDCPVSQMSEAPTVRIQRPGDVTGAPDCPVCHATEALTNGSFGGWGYKYPPTTPLQCIQGFSLQIPYKSYNIQYKTQSKRSNPLPSPKIIPIK